MMRDHQYEDLLRDGITAAKSGERKTAQWLLNQAVMMRPMDARPYIWLSATTDDSQQKKNYLEEALARDPSNAAARRGLVALASKLDPQDKPGAGQLLPEGAGLAVQPPAEPVEAQAQSFKCPHCGGNMTSTANAARLTCDYCGYAQSIAAPAARGVDQDLPLDVALPTERAHQWAKTQHLLACSDCGAVGLLPSGLAATQCAYCGSNQLVQAPEMAELIDPQAILPFKLDEKQAMQSVKAWLKGGDFAGGFFAPDNLLSGSHGLRLRPAYYSAWVFDGTIEFKWTCEIYVGNGRTKEWKPRNGSNIEFFDDVLVPGVKSLNDAELAGVGPFQLKSLPPFSPDYLAGWPTIFYDRALSDALLLAREKVMRGVRSRAYSLIEPGRNKRNLNIGGGSWSGQTFRHVLLPLWLGNYTYAGKAYRLLVNGNTGKVGGFKPRDNVKIIFTILIGVILLVILFTLFTLFTPR